MCSADQSPETVTGPWSHRPRPQLAPTQLPNVGILDGVQIPGRDGCEVWISAVVQWTNHFGLQHLLLVSAHAVKFKHELKSAVAHDMAWGCWQWPTKTNSQKFHAHNLSLVASWQTQDRMDSSTHAWTGYPQNSRWKAGVSCIGQHSRKISVITTTMMMIMTITVGNDANGNGHPFNLTRRVWIQGRSTRRLTMPISTQGRSEAVGYCSLNSVGPS